MAKPDTVQVLYALPERQVIVEVAYRQGLTAADAVERSGLKSEYPDIAAEPLVLGVWGQEVDPAHPLTSGDRVEISRPLVADARDMRRTMMSDGRVMGGAVSVDQVRGSRTRSRSIRDT